MGLCQVSSKKIKICILLSQFNNIKRQAKTLALGKTKMEKLYLKPTELCLLVKGPLLKRRANNKQIHQSLISTKSPLSTAN